MVSEFLFYEDNADKEEKSNYIDLKIKIRELLKNDFNRKVLTEVLLDLRKDVSGDTRQRLFQLFTDLGLDKDAYDKLNSWRWEVIAKGISQLTQMQVEEAYSFIVKFINDRRSTVRKQAEIATVTLKPEGINHFLDTTRYKISEWQQLKLLDVLRNREDFEPPRFKYWLTSSNKHVVLFALRLIKHYNQNDANTALIELVKHKNNQIKVEAIGCIKEFYVTNAVSTLQQVFPKNNVDVKIAILGAIGELGEESAIEFLNKVAKSEGNFAVKSKALAAINMIAPDTIMPTEGIDNSNMPLDTVLEANDVSCPTNLEDNPTNHSLSELEKKEEVGEDFAEDETLSAIEEPSVKAESLEQEEKELIEEVTEETVELSVEAELENNDDIREIEVNYEYIEFEVEAEEYDIPKEIEELVQSDATSSKSLEINHIVPKKKATDREKQPELAELFTLLQDAIRVEKSTNASPSLNKDFLPLVVESLEHESKEPHNQKTMEANNQKQPDIKKIKVCYELVQPISSNTQEDKDDFDVTDITFLPIVTDNDIESSVENIDMVDDVCELDFLPIVTSDKEENKEGQNGETKPNDSMKEQSFEGFKLSDFEIDFEPQQSVEENKEENNLEFELEETALTNFETQNEGAEDVISWLIEHNEINQIEVVFEEVNGDGKPTEYNELIPEPVYYDEHEAYMMQLLDDLEDMGDHREIPLLNELLEAETKAFIKERIKNLITSFTLPEGITVKTTENNRVNKLLPFFSVFADLFKNIDRESKLILLDEIVEVGDEKEIRFLDTLLEDPDSAIREKAQVALKELVEKLSKKDDSEISKKKKRMIYVLDGCSMKKWRKTIRK